MSHPSQEYPSYEYPSQEYPSQEWQMKARIKEARCCRQTLDLCPLKLQPFTAFATSHKLTSNFSKTLHRHENHSNEAFKGLLDSLPPPTRLSLWKEERMNEWMNEWNVSLILVNLRFKMQTGKRKLKRNATLSPEKDGQGQFWKSSIKAGVNRLPSVILTLWQLVLGGLFASDPESSLYKFDRSICIFNPPSFSLLSICLRISKYSERICAVINAFWFITLDFWLGQLKSLNEEWIT